MDSDSLDDDGLDAFFDAADTKDKTRVHLAAEKMRRGLGGSAGTESIERVETDDAGRTNNVDDPADPADLPDSVYNATAASDPTGALDRRTGVDSADYKNAGGAEMPDAGQDLPKPRRNTAARPARNTSSNPAEPEEIDPEIEKIAASLVELVDEIHTPESERLLMEKRSAPDKSRAPSAVPDDPFRTADTSGVPGPGGTDGDTSGPDDDDDEVPPWLAHPTNVPTPSAAFSAVPPAMVGIPDERSGPKRRRQEEDSDSARLLLNDLEGKFIAIAPEDNASDTDDPFILVPANVHSVVPWWGWLTIVLGLGMLVAGVILLPLITLNRTAAKLGDRNENAARNAMRQLVLRGDERTVKKLFSIASAPDERVDTRLRAIDTMTLIERVPEVDRALLRLELSDSTHEQVREAAIAARRQREAARARTRQRR